MPPAGGKDQSSGNSSSANSASVSSFSFSRTPSDETALRELSEGVIEKLKLLTDAEFAELEFPPD